MDEIGKYKKKKSQKSKAEKRSDHKHEYEKSIEMTVNTVNGAIDGFYWTTHCRVCGRLGKFDYRNNDDFRRPEWKGKHLWWSSDMYITFDEVVTKYPDIPIYRRDPDDWFKEIRVR